VVALFDRALKMVMNERRDEGGDEGGLDFVEKRNVDPHFTDYRRAVKVSFHHRLLFQKLLKFPSARL